MSFGERLNHLTTGEVGAALSETCRPEHLRATRLEDGLLLLGSHASRAADQDGELPCAEAVLGGAGAPFSGGTLA